MRRTLMLCIAVSVLAGCSSPKYTYNFDYYDYQSGKKTISENAIERKVDDRTLTASAAIDKVIHTTTEDTSLPVTAPGEEIAEEKQLSDMTRVEKKVLRKEVKRELKKYLKDIGKNDINRNALNPDASAEMDHDLKLAIIFGAVGLTLSLFSGINAAFWVLGVIAIVVGVVFLIRWLVRQ